MINAEYTRGMEVRAKGGEKLARATKDWLDGWDAMDTHISQLLKNALDIASLRLSIKTTPKYNEAAYSQ